MHDNQYWLPPLEDGAAAFRQIADCASGSAEAWSQLVRIAHHRLDFLTQLKLDRAFQKQAAAGAAAGLTPLRLAILGSATTENLFPAIRAAGLRNGLAIEIFAPDYGQYVQAILDPTSQLHRFQPQVVLFALDGHHLLQPLEGIADEAEAEAALAAQVEQLSGLWARARDAFGCDVVQQAALPVFPELFGPIEPFCPFAPAQAAHHLNDLLRRAARRDGVHMLNVDRLAARLGLSRWFDRVLWHKAKQEHSAMAAPFYGDHLVRVIAARLGRSRKCLVLDLDNTLWGGVIGDDGVEGITLGQGDAAGEAFLAFHGYVKALSGRGVILAVNSKNDAANALMPFQQHPDCLLKREDFAVFAANWQDKATNLRQIAAELEIGLDALVFVDDNPAERALVRRELPMVAVPELPADPAFYAQCLADAGYFDVVTFTADDRQRGQQYQANARRRELQQATTDMAAFLSGLEMVMAAAPLDGVSLPRVAQLVNKTNQFNLTTRRHGEADIARMAAQPGSLVLQFRLTDRFGDNGLCAVIIALPDGDGRLVVDSWLMSCRVLGRGVEQACLNVLVEQAGRLGYDALVGEYLPTAKNAMVKEHYPNLGFAPDGDGRWILPVAGFTPLSHHIQVKGPIDE